jgi:hypothetical protein
MEFLSLVVFFCSLYLYLHPRPVKHFKVVLLRQDAVAVQWVEIEGLYASDGENVVETVV